MGLLDDAIREHLDLKRRRGADPEEVERAEREALGPVRRGPEDREPLEAADEGSHAYDDGDEGSLAYGDRADAEWEESDEELEDYDEPTASKHPAADEPHDEVLGEEDLFAEDEPVQPERATSPPPSGTATPPPQPAPGVAPHGDKTSEETVEYDVERALEKEPAGEEDVLEETPEFLQDTPDHDRLWFEQRPPRDFDFNE